MKKNIQILGFSEPIKGTSKKTQRPYNFTEVSFGIEADYFSGVKCFTKPVDGSVIGDHQLAVGEILSVELFYIDREPRIVCIY